MKFRNYKEKVLERYEKANKKQKERKSTKVNWLPKLRMKSKKIRTKLDGMKRGKRRKIRKWQRNKDMRKAQLHNAMKNIKTR